MAEKASTNGGEMIGRISITPKSFLNDMIALGVQNRTFALAQNGTWAPASGKLMTEKLQNLKNMTILENMMTIKSALHSSDEDAVEAFAEAIVKA